MTVLQSASDQKGESADSAPISHRQTRYAPPATATTFLLVRHGASEPYVEGNPFPLVHGHGDPALDSSGLEQAQLLVARLQQERVAAVYVTPLRRTQQTIAPYASAAGHTPVEVFDLREVFLGDWEGGQFRVRMAAGDPQLVRAIAEGEWGHIPGAETSAALQERCVRALMNLHEQHKGQKIICVAHGGVIAELCRWVTRSPLDYQWGPENASITTLIINSENIGTDMYRRLHNYNDTRHLDFPL